MKLCEDITTTTYQAEHEGVTLLIDIVEDTLANIFEAYGYLEGTGDKVYLFGLSREGITKEEFLEIIERSLPDFLEDLDE